MAITPLTQAAVAALDKVGANCDLVVTGALIKASDKWGDHWTALVAEDADALAALELHDIESVLQPEGRFVLVVPCGSEGAGREKLAFIESSEDRPGPLVWGLTAD